MLIYKQEPEEVIAAQRLFISNCTAITADILTIPNSPWSFNADPVRYWVANGQDRLGELQARLIRFLHRNFFRRGKPVFMKARSIAERMVAPKSQIQTAISALVDRGILIRIHFMYNSTNRTMLIPGTPQFKNFRNDFIETEGQIQGGYNIFAKLPKSLQNSSALYNILLFFKQEYLNLKVKLQSIGKKLIAYGYRCATALPAIASTKPAPLLQRLKQHLKQKPPSAYSESLKQKLMKANYDIKRLSVTDRNDVVAQIDRYLMIDIHPLLKHAGNQYKTVSVPAEKALYMVCWMYANDRDIDPTYTLQVLDNWNTNAKGHHVVSACKPGEVKLLYRSIILSYFKHTKGESFVTRAVSRLFNGGCMHKNIFFMNRKVTLEEVFLNPYDKKLWYTMLHDSDRNWAIFMSNDGDIGELSDEDASIRADFRHFFQWKNVDDYLDKHWSSIRGWFSRLKHSARQYERDLGGMDLFYSKGELASVFFMFFAWYDDFGRPETGMVDIDHLTSQQTWRKFKSYMRNEHSQYFWMTPEEIQKEKEGE